MVEGVKNEIVVDGVKFKLEKGQKGFVISSLDLENSQKLKSFEIFEGFSEDFAQSSFQKLEFIKKEKGLISLQIQPYKDPIKLVGEKVAAVDLGYPVSWSSSWDGNTTNYRLDSFGMHSKSCSAWSASINDKNQWIQVASIEPKYWTGVTIQGRGDCDQRITKFVVKGSMGSKWEEVDEGTVFDGVTSKSAQVTIEFRNPILARTLRICPTEWYGHISIRFEAYFLG